MVLNLSKGRLSRDEGWKKIWKENKNEYDKSTLDKYVKMS